VRIVGNLPFAVATELLLKWLRQIPEREGPFAHGTHPLSPCMPGTLTQAVLDSRRIDYVQNFGSGRASMTLMFQLEVGKVRALLTDEQGLHYLVAQQLIASPSLP
jgi:hypothetical protein